MGSGVDVTTPTRKTGFTTVKKCQHRSILRKQQKRLRCQKRKRSNNINRRIWKLEEEMKVVAEEQRSVKKGQEEVREKLRAVGAECDQLRKETEVILQQRAATLLRLNPIVEILKAKKDCNLSKVTNLISNLRELMRKQNEPQPH